MDESIKTKTAPTIKDARWREWTDAFFVFKPEDVSPMSVEQSEIFLSMMLGELSQQSFDEIEEDFKNHFLWQVFTSRLEYYGVKVTPWAKTFIFSSCKNPGQVVMWTHALKRMNEDNPKQPINMESLSNRFPVGFPTKERLHYLWDMQKVAPEGHSMMDNYLDQVQNAKGAV